jgi:hypothetical protein
MLAARGGGGKPDHRAREERAAGEHRLRASVSAREIPVPAPPEARMARRSSIPFAWAIACVAASGLAVLAEPAAAQATGDGYLFGRPRVTLSLRGGYDRPTAQGQLFDDLFRQLTLGRSSLGAPAANAELAVTLTRRLDLAIHAGYAAATRGSEFRGFVDNDDAPIAQTTTLRRVPLGIGLKGYLAPRGREIGQFAWIPARVAPFVGVGAGAVRYSFRQDGSFVDFQTLDVFDAGYGTSGWAAAGYAHAGADWSLSPRLVLSGELRYTAARAAPAGDFREYSRIDLSGAALNVGLGVRF